MVLPIHRCVLALYTQYFPCFTVKKSQTYNLRNTELRKVLSIHSGVKSRTKSNILYRGKFNIYSTIKIIIYLKKNSSYVVYSAFDKILRKIKNKFCEIKFLMIVLSHPTVNPHYQDGITITQEYIMPNYYWIKINCTIKFTNFTVATHNFLQMEAETKLSYQRTQTQVILF